MSEEFEYIDRLLSDFGMRMDGFKPIDRVREYGVKTEKVETSEFPNEPKWHFVDNGKERVEVSRKVLCEDDKC